MKRILILLWISAAVVYASQAAVQIVQPSVHDINYEGQLPIVIAADNSQVDVLLITTDTNKALRIEVNAQRSHYCENIALHFGENNVTVTALKGTEKIAEEKRAVYYMSPVHKEHRYPPDPYIKRFFHTNVNDELCSKCHDMSVNEVEGVAFENVRESNCYDCHKGVTARQHGHAPAVNWLCTSCHNGETGEFNEHEEGLSKYTVPDPIAPLCLHCHEKHEQLWKTKRFNHELADSGGCNKCLNSHSSKELFYLRKSNWELCTGCHKEKVAGTHIVKTFTRVMHPTHNVKDPSRPGKDLTCTSCHNPHVSNSSSLHQSESVMGLCSRYHKK